MYYLVKIGYETEQEGRNGEVKTKIKKEKYIIQAESVEEATIIASKYASEDIRSSESLSVSKIDIECLIDKKNTPQYYK